MPLFKTKFHVSYRHTELVDDEVHPLFESIKPLTPAQMLKRAMHGQPINVHSYNTEERLIFNKRFFGGDRMETIDSIQRAQQRLNKKISQQPKQPKQPQQPQQPQQPPSPTPSNGVAQ